MAEQEEYEYRGLMAEFWDLLRGDTSQWADRFFYRDVIAASGQPVLDVGCGTGRLLLDYLAQGTDIDGVDNSPEMLALCREKGVQQGLQPQLYLQQMETLDLPRIYRTILVPSSSFQLIVDPAHAAAALDRFFAHLESGGTLVMPFMVFYTGPAEAGQVAEDWHLVVEKVRPADGAIIRRWSRSTYDVPAQIEHTEDRYEVLRDGEVVATESHKRSPAGRWYTQEQAVALYTAAGFTDIRVLKEFTFDPAGPAATLFCVLGTRP
jgi:ubiquinone/menaquinone biosynthesis C-methylase UbiE